jgi:hypothetical protein
MQSVSSLSSISSAQAVQATLAQAPSGIKLRSGKVLSRTVTQKIKRLPLQTEQQAPFPVQKKDVEKVPSQTETIQKILFPFLPEEIVSILKTEEVKNWDICLERSNSQGEHLARVFKIIVEKTPFRELAALNYLAESIRKDLSKSEKDALSLEAKKMYRQALCLYDELGDSESSDVEQKVEPQAPLLRLKLRRFSIHEPKLKKPLHIVGSFLNPYDIALAQSVSPKFAGLLKNKMNHNWFTLHAGALSCMEKVTNIDLNEEFRRSKFREKLSSCLRNRNFAVCQGGDLHIKNLDKEGFFTKVAYYSGWYHESLAKNFDDVRAKRLKATKGFRVDLHPPTTPITVRIKNFSAEILGMQQGLKKSRKILGRETEKLNFFAAIICKISQRIFSFVMQSSNTLENLKLAHLYLVEKILQTSLNHLYSQSNRSLNLFRVKPELLVN